MKNVVAIIGIVSIISFVGSILLLNWIVNDDATKSFLVATTDNHSIDGVANTYIIFDGKKVLLTVTLTHAMTCEELIDTLGLETLPLRGKIYAPSCTSVTKDTIIITYEETDMT